MASVWRKEVAHDQETCPKTAEGKKQTKSALYRQPPSLFAFLSFAALSIIARMTRSY